MSPCALEWSHAPTTATNLFIGIIMCPVIFCRAPGAHLGPWEHRFSFHLGFCEVVCRVVAPLEPALAPCEWPKAHAASYCIILKLVWLGWRGPCVLGCGTSHTQITRWKTRFSNACRRRKYCRLTHLSTPACSP
jgi:hypothetical protein